MPNIKLIPSSKPFFRAMLLLAAGVLSSTTASACSRVVYQGPKGTIITARSMDWNEDMKTNLWIFPSGLERNGEAGPNSLKWTSKFGSVIATAYDLSLIHI